MKIVNLFDNKAKQLFWRALDPTHLIGAPPPRSIDPGQTYYVIRLCEMYLAEARKLWRQIYPMVHCFTKAGAVESHTIASPAQLSDLGNVNLDRIANLDVRLFGPAPYNGEEVSILAGLYAIPGHDSAKALIDLVSSFAALDPASISKAVVLSDLVNSGVESILGIDQAGLQLGIRDSFGPGARPLQSGFFAGIGAPDQSVDVSQIWVVNGRLVKGKDPNSALPYSDHDYMLLSIEALTSRDDWQQLIGIQACRQRFSNILSDTLFSVAEKRSRLAAYWPVFVQTLADSADLIDADRDRIAGLVSADLIRKLKTQQDSNPFLQAA